MPAIIAADRDAGFVLMEDFGADGVAAGDAPVPERYRVALEALAAIHAAPRPEALPIPGGGTHTPAAPRRRRARRRSRGVSGSLRAVGDRRRRCRQTARTAFADIWQALAARLAGGEQSWVLFDVQSPNLFWLPERQGMARVGFIDFQDMFVGPAAYDVATLCQDARVSVPPALETELVAHYAATRRAAAPGFDAVAFTEAYAILAAARALKNLGLFARLAAGGQGGLSAAYSTFA